VTEKRLRFDDLPIPGPLCEGEGSPVDSSCLIWHGKFPHKYYGSDVPAFRSQGIVNMSADDLVDVIMDSDRVAEYNRSSIGRTDEVILSDGSDLEGPFSGKRKKKLTGVVMEGSKIIDGKSLLLVKPVIQVVNEILIALYQPQVLHLLINLTMMMKVALSPSQLIFREKESHLNLLELLKSFEGM
jgi:hypothetical protein